MEELNFPSFEFLYRNTSGKKEIFDSIRKKYLILSPEEWVRQHTVRYFLEHLSFPKNLCKLEGGLKINALQKRTDILFYDRKGCPFMLIECKSPKIKLTEKVFQQAAVYNLELKAPYIFITNGKEHFVFQNHETGYLRLNQIPEFPAP